MSRIGFIGTGHVAAPMARFLARKGHQIAVTTRSRAVSAALRASHGVTVGEPQEVIDTSDIVFLCVRPHQAAPLLPTLTFRADQAIVSAMAAVSLAELARLCAPATRFVRTIPMRFIDPGGCPLAACGDTALLAGLFDPENPVIPVANEAALNAHFAISTMVSGTLDILSSAAGWLGEQTGDKDGAELFTAQMVAGYLAAMDKTGPAGALAAERDTMAMDGTLSLQMTTGLRDGGAHDALRATLTGLLHRLETR